MSAMTRATDPRPAPEVVVMDEPLYEVIDGEKEELPPMGVRENSVAMAIALELGIFLRATRLGRAIPENLFDLAPNGQQRRPDVAYVSYERWPRERRTPRTAAWAVVPDLAVEVVSPSNTMDEVLIKTGEYFRAGVRLVWVVMPVTEQVYAYTSLGSLKAYSRGETLPGDPVLPGFALPLDALFEDGTED